MVKKCCQTKLEAENLGAPTAWSRQFSYVWQYQSQQASTSFMHSDDNQSADMNKRTRHLAWFWAWDESGGLSLKATANIKYYYTCMQQQRVFLQVGQYSCLVTATEDILCVSEVRLHVRQRPMNIIQNPCMAISKQRQQFRSSSTEPLPEGGIWSKARYSRGFENMLDFDSVSYVTLVFSPSTMVLCQ